MAWKAPNPNKKLAPGSTEIMGKMVKGHDPNKVANKIAKRGS